MSFFRILLLILFSLMCCGTKLTACVPPPFYPITVSGSYLAVNPAELRKPEDLDDQKLQYIQKEIAYAYTHPIDPLWGLIFGAGWVQTEVNWPENPLFSETCFNYVTFSVGCFSKTFPDWTWTVTGSLFIDTEVLDLSDNALYQGVLLGQFHSFTCLELQFGCIVELGLNREKVWPVLGFVYTCSPALRLYCVYPVKIALEYQPWTPLTLSASIRFLRNRHRVKDTEFLPKAIFEYRSTGIEFDCTYKPFTFLLVTGFIGSTWNGDFAVTNMHNRHDTHFTLASALYLGISGYISF